MSDGYDERMRRWRLVLGEAGVAMPLNGGDARIDAALGALYDSENTDRTGSPQRQAGFGASAPRVARWLGDIRTFFPVSVVQVMQKDAIERLGLTRLLLDAGLVSPGEADMRMSRALSAAVPAPAAAGWAEGFLAGSGLLLVHDDKLLALADGWLAGLSADAFTAVLPALRRTFGEFAPPERRAIGQKAALLDGSGRGPVVVADASEDLDSERAALAARAVALILGWPGASRAVAP